MDFSHENSSSIALEDMTSDEVSKLALHDQHTPLHYACQHGRVDVVAQQLITNGKCSIVSRDAQGCTPLHTAAQYGQVETLKYLLHKLFSHEVSGLSVKLRPGGKLSHTLSSMFQQKLSNRHRDQSGNTPLHTACVHGQLDIVQLLTHEIGCDPNYTNSEGLSCLHLAAQHGHLPLVRYLVEEVGSDVSLEDEHGRSPTYLAAEGGNLDILKYLIEEKGANIHFKTSKEWKSAKFTMAHGRTLMHTASREGHLHVVKYLVEHHGCDPSCRDGKGYTPLYLACQEGHMDIVSYLITECHCDPNCTTEDDSNTPLHLASRYGHLEVVKFLIEVIKCDPDIKGQQKRTPLHYSSGGGHLNVVKYLVNTCHCDPLCPDEDGSTPLHLAAAGGDIGIVKYITLIPDICSFPSDKYNNRPLHYAASSNQLNVVKLYIKEKACDPNIKGAHGRAPLHFSLKKKCLSVSIYLIDLPNCNVLARVPDFVSGALTNPLRLAVETNSIELVRYMCTTRRLDPYLQDDKAQLLEACKNAAMVQLLHGYTDPLNYAAANGDLKCVQHYMEKRGWNPLKLDRHGQNTLHYAAENGHVEVVKYFTEEGKIDLNSKDQWNNTPLHHASMKGHLDVVKCLLRSHRCDPLCQNVFSCTALHIAASNNSLDVVAFLIEKIKNDPNVKGELNKTPLHLAILNRHLEIAMYLIDLPNTDVLSTTSDGVNPLLLAVKEQNLEIVSYLCRTRRVDPYLQPDREKLLRATTDPAILEFLTNYPDPLHCAAVYGDVETVRHHVETKKWDPLKLDRYGNNTLHNAAQHGQLEVVKYLTGLSKDPINEGVEILCDPLGKNKYGLTALDIASQNGHRHVVSYLLRATSNQLIFQQDVLSPVLSIFVVGNTGSGKSTLVKALSAESSLLGGMRKVKGVTPLTAGIVPTTLHSKVFGTVNVYDFAGHEEYYASHEMILCQTTQPLVILAVDISLPEHDVMKQVLYWLAILSNSLSSDATRTMHVLIVGSHSDQIKFIEKKEVYQHMTTWTRGSAASLQYHGFIQCDCRFSSSDNLNQLRLKLSTICTSVRLFLLAHESDHSNKLCAALMYHLEQNKPEQATVTVRELFRLLTESITPGSGLVPFADQNLLLQTCKLLNSNGHLLFLPHDESEMESVIILDRDTVLSKVHACLQAKEYLTNKIGILDEEKLKFILSLSLKGIMETALAIKYLIFTQFCTEITANQLISVPENFAGMVHYFFPSLVSASRPADLLPLGDHYTHFLTWGLECTCANQFFAPRFLHTLFIQLTKCERDAINARFIIWKNGILLVHNNGTRSILEVTGQTTRLHLAMQCVKGCELYLVKQRSALIHLIKSLLDKVCQRKVEIKEFLCLPQTTYPFDCNGEVPLFDVAQSVISGSPTVVFDYENVLIRELLYFDSFYAIKDLTLQDLFTRCQSTDVIPSTTFSEILDAVKECEELVNILGVEATSQRMTYNKLCRELNKYSIFTEGNLYALVGVNISSCALVCDSEEDLQSVPNLDLLGIADLYLVNINLIEVLCPWKFGRALGLKPHTLEKIKSRYFYRHHVDRCFTEVLAVWLKGEDRSHDSPGPNWEDVVTALKSVDMRDHAHQLLQKLAKADGVTESADPFSSVDNSEIASGSLREVAGCIHDLSHKWFHLGLSLGLRYLALKNIEASHHHDIGDHMTDMLLKWLKGVDTGEVRGPPSWRSLARALDSPLVREGQFSRTIQREHQLNQILLDLS